MIKRPRKVVFGFLLTFGGGMVGEGLDHLYHSPPALLTQFAQQRREFMPPEHYEPERMVEPPAASVAVIMTSGATVTAQTGLSTGVGASVANRLMRACVHCGARFEVTRSESVCSNCARGA
jgi:hypothetical protein